MAPPAVIIGAGLAGLLAGALDRRAHIYEAQPELPNNHAAVLRFREDKIARALDIPFRRVRVLKEVFDPAGPIRDANDYSMKVANRISSRSILDLAPADRYIAPPNLIEQLAEMNAGRISLGVTIVRDQLNEWIARGTRIISTIPLPRLLDMLCIEYDWQEFAYSGVQVRKWIVDRCDVFQTIYFPRPEHAFYRASITGNELLAEAMEGVEVRSVDVFRVLGAFGIPLMQVSEVETGKQTLGKIVPLPDAKRKALLLRLSTEFGIFSLGRYACWRNILLDDVFEDYYRVRRLMELDSQYDFRRHVS
jgi:hypothetical protein